MSLMIFGYVSAVLMGLTLGLLGGGGSILTVPILVYLFAMNPIDATASSLFIVGMTAALASIQYFKRNEVNIGAGIRFVLAGSVGIFFSRSFLLPRLPEEIFTWGSFVFLKEDLVLTLFAGLMVTAATSMLKTSRGARAQENKPNPRGIAALGAVIGAITGFVGAGGGFLILPVLVRWVGLPMRVAAGTSLVIIAINTLFGFTVSLAQGIRVQWGLQISFLALAMAGSWVGARWSRSVNEKILKKAFGIFVLVVGSLILLERIALR